MTEPPDHNILDNILDQYGPDQAQSYLYLQKAVRGIVTVWHGYIQAPTGSLREAQFAEALNRMLSALEKNPEKGVALIEGLLTLIHSMRMGGTYEEWFESMGLEPNPEKGEMQ